MTIVTTINIFHYCVLNQSHIFRKELECKDRKWVIVVRNEEISFASYSVGKDQVHIHQLCADSLKEEMAKTIIQVLQGLYPDKELYGELRKNNVIGLEMYERLGATQTKCTNYPESTYVGLVIPAPKEQLPLYRILRYE